MLYPHPFCVMRYLYTPYPDGLFRSMGLGNSPQLSMSNKCKQNHTRRACVGKCRARWREGQAQTSRRYGGGTRTQIQGMRTYDWLAAQTPRSWQRACFCRCHCRVLWLPQLLLIQSSAQDTGPKRKASANKGKICTRTRKHSHKAITSTTPALPRSRARAVTCLVQPLSRCLLAVTHSLHSGAARPIASARCLENQHMSIAYYY